MFLNACLLNACHITARYIASLAGTTMFRSKLTCNIIRSNTVPRRKFRTVCSGDWHDLTTIFTWHLDSIVGHQMLRKDYCCYYSIIQFRNKHLCENHVIMLYTHFWWADRFKTHCRVACWRLLTCLPVMKPKKLLYVRWSPVTQINSA